MVGWSLGLFAVLRSPWADGFVLPLTRFQQNAAVFYLGQPVAPINVTAACSGTDVLALCLAAILAWPAPWRARLAGSLGGIALILVLNTLRIGTLGRFAADPALFEALHLQVWPMILVLATAAFVVGWMRVTKPRAAISLSSNPVRRFGMLALLSLTVFAFCGPWIARSETLLAASAWTAGEAARLLSVLGVGANASGSILTTTRGSFMVTPECLATALIPLYLAGLLAAPLRPSFRLLGLFAAAPFFAMLAIARLLLLALPPFLAASPLFLVHGFHQFVFGLMIVVAFAWHREATGRDWILRTTERSVLSIGLGTTVALIAGDLLTSVVTLAARAFIPEAPALIGLSGAEDAQGALATMVTFQIGLLLAIGVARGARLGRILASLSALFAIEIAAFVLLGEAASRFGGIPHALLLRAWAVAVPVLLALTMLRPKARDEASQPFVAAHDPA